MSEFTTVEETLFVPMLGRIYASEQFPHLFSDPKALELKPRLPQNLKGQETQTQYTLMASAIRSANLDRAIQDFLRRCPNGVIVQLGCGLETAFYRNDNGNTLWYEVDLPKVIAYRQELLGQPERDHSIPADAFGSEWLQQVRQAHPTDPILVTASGLFYYFPRETVLSLFRSLSHAGPVEILFDTVNSAGMKRMSHYMDQVGHADTPMYFYVDQAEDLAAEAGLRLRMEEPYYAHVDKHGLLWRTSLTMKISDRFRMVKMVHLETP